MSPPRFRPAWALVLSGAALLAYANGLTGAFTYDDKAIVRDNPRLRAPARIAEIIGTQYFGGPPGTGTAYRPVLLLSYAVQWWIHGGVPVAFHAVNLLLHVAVTLLLARLFLTLGIPPPASVGAALLFAVHPIHVEAVTSVVGRGETLSAALALASILAGLSGLDAERRTRRRRARIGLSLLAYGAAILTKESAAVAPALLFLCRMWTSEGGLLRRSRAALFGAAAYWAASAATLLLVFRLRAAILGGALRSAGTGIFELENPLAHLPPLERALNACLVFWRYVGRMALPLRLSADESAWSIRPVSAGDPAAWAAAGLLAALVVVSLRTLPRRSTPADAFGRRSLTADVSGRRSLAAFGFLFLFVAALPASNLLFPTGTIFAERLAYLPSAGFCLVAAGAIVGAGATPDAVPRMRVAALALIAFLFAARTVVRNPVWDSDEALFTNMVAVSPRSAKAHYDFAYMSAELGNPRRALRHYTRATEIYPGYWDAWAGKGRMQRLLGDPDAAEASYAESLRVHPSYENGYFGIGLAREQRGDLRGAEQAYRDGLRRKPRSFPLAYRLARVLAAEGRREATFAWRRALAIEPGSKAAKEEYAQWKSREP